MNADKKAEGKIKSSIGSKKNKATLQTIKNNLGKIEDELTLKTKKKSNEQLIKQWMEQNNVCGTTLWFDKQNLYYELKIEQIVDIYRFIVKNTPEVINK